MRLQVLLRSVGITPPPKSPSLWIALRPNALACGTATMPDPRGPAAATDDTDFALTLEEVAGRYAAAHPRTLRPRRRTASPDTLDCRTAATAPGEKPNIIACSRSREIDLPALMLFVIRRTGSSAGCA